ncbi:heterokaryon incompatibility protein-domain-containing protein [Coniella lustricola]|uniref:Heterokaryon incompatibility protein-domain-containing protein n=1 Tax=Coniella lustricola TaxID=2025994 RepID=A0A2T3AE39_9PEZI|nr:heterokaryon incompatibility protein-domain-containing protein [Coniella lustricola]
MADATAGLPMYRYQALPSENHIRRLELRPALSINDPLVGSMDVIDFAKVDLYPYQAISYAWGSASKDHWIRVDGQQLPIASSLATALSQARNATETVAVWADGVCINQDDDGEKGHQVKRMGNIYKSSICTLICLGYWGGEQVVIASDLIRDVMTMLNAIFEDPGFSWQPDSCPWPDADSPLLLSERWQAVAVLTRHAWFGRGWTMQEVALSRSSLILWAGRRIPWLDLVTACMWFYYRVIQKLPNLLPLGVRRLHVNHAIHKYKDLSKRIQTMMNRTDMNTQAPFTTLETLNQARFLHLTDARDRIYAFMAIPTADSVMEALELDPDYSSGTSPIDVYRDFAIKYLDKTRDLDILRYTVAEQSIQALGSTPSWVPHWNSRISMVKGDRFKTMKFTNRMAEATDTPEFTWQDDGSVLCVQAILFDAIAHIAPTPPPLGLEYNHEMTVDYMLATWRDMAPKSAEHPGPHHHRLAIALITAMCFGHYMGSEQEWLESAFAFARLLETDTADRSDQVYLQVPHAKFFLQAIMIRGMCKRLALLGCGLHGLVPSAARKDDICAIIVGTRMPLILRKIEGDGHRYTIVGPAYFQSKIVGRQSGIPLPLGWSKDSEDWIDMHMPFQEILIY